jgi:3-deoxy-manno-octulosonate cytidylyltransferase (CMP-KDO synthetase)
VVDNNDKALYFSRSMIPYGATEFLYHIGIYGFHKDTLKKFVKLPQSALEIQEKLEQLRALQYDIDIGICYVDDIPISVDTIDDLNKAIEYYNLLKLST